MLYFAYGNIMLFGKMWIKTEIMSAEVLRICYKAKSDSKMLIYREECTSIASF